jgi:hypothetical protein
MKDPGFIDAQSNADLLDAMADKAYEQEQAMREADQSDFILIDLMEDMHDDESN